jgi:hypothetical protein
MATTVARGGSVLQLCYETWQLATFRDHKRHFTSSHAAPAVFGDETQACPVNLQLHLDTPAVEIP